MLFHLEKTLKILAIICFHPWLFNASGEGNYEADFFHNIQSLRVPAIVISDLDFANKIAS